LAIDYFPDHCRVAAIFLVGHERGEPMTSGMVWNRGIYAVIWCIALAGIMGAAFLMGWIR
jgi:hypothetical protein